MIFKWNDKTEQSTTFYYILSILDDKIGGLRFYSQSWIYHIVEVDNIPYTPHFGNSYAILLATI